MHQSLPQTSAELARAEQICRRRLAADPFDIDALRTLGQIQQAQDRLVDAAATYQELIRVRPTDADATRLLGNALYLLGRYAEAADCYRRACVLRPDDADAHCNLGAALADQGMLAEAIPCYEQALRLRPQFPSAQFNLGNALRLLDRCNEAASAYAEALRLQPHFAECHNNLGIALYRQGRLAEALASYREAIRLWPGFGRAHTNLGLALADSGRLAEAEAAHEEALRLLPDDPDAHRNRSLALLLLGDYERGLPEYDWRWRCADFSPPRTDRPRWDGSPLDGRTILLYTEQGMGDTLQFVRFVPHVQQRGGRVVLAAPASLHPVLSRCVGIEQLVPLAAEPPPFDAYCPLMSLAAVFGTTLATIPNRVPYLRADPALSERWRRELAGIPGFKVGIAWQGNPRVLYDRSRSIPLRAFEPLAKVAGVRLISLQKGQGTEQLGSVAQDFEVIALRPDLDETSGALMDTAAIIENLDLVVTCDTVIAHLAGALAARAWVALPLVPDWRWLLDREDSPWYPSLRLFRQIHAGSWAEPFARMAKLLAIERA